MKKLFFAAGMLGIISCTVSEKNTTDSKIKSDDPVFQLSAKSQVLATSGDLDSAIIYSDSIISMDTDTSLINQAKQRKDQFLALKEKKNAINQEIKKLQKRTTIKKDEFSSNSFIETNKFKHYTNTNLISIYLSHHEYGCTPFLMLSYTGDEWIFFEDVVLKSGDDILNVSFDRYQDKKTDHDSDVWEWLNMRASSDVIDFLENASNNGDLKIRLRGKYNKDRIVSKKEISALKDMIQIYRLNEDLENVKYTL